jgi:hypothetical protein
VFDNSRKTLVLSVALTSFLFFRDIQALVIHINETFDVSSEDNDFDMLKLMSADHGFADLGRLNKSQVATPKLRFIITSVTSALSVQGLQYDQLAGVRRPLASSLKLTRTKINLC